jgi:hypothetical protein
MAFIKKGLHKKKIAVFFVFIFLFISTHRAFSWETLKTDHFTVFYEPEYEYQAREFLKALEYYRPKVENLTQNQAYRLPIIIEDIGTIANGMTDPITNRIFLFTYPPSASSLGTSIQNWATFVGVHEYTHLLHLTKVGGLMEAIKTLFGNYFLPNVYSLGWVTEGITVYSESQLSPYQGRLNDGYYTSYIASRVKDNRFPSILESAYSPIEYPYGDGIYNYGGMFFDYMAKTYGEDKFAKFFDQYGSSLPVLMFGMSASQTYGRSLPKLWKEWKQYESERFKNFHNEGEKLTQKGDFASDLVFYNDKLYYTRTNIKKTGAFNAWSFSNITQKDTILVPPSNGRTESGKEKCIVSTTSSFTTPIKIHKGHLYYAVAEIKPGYANTSYMTYGYYSIVHDKNLTTGEDKVCLKDGLRDFEVLSDGSIIYSKDIKDSFGSEIIRYDRNTREKKELFEVEYLVDRIVVNEDRIIVSARKDWENYNLYSLDLNKQQLTPLVPPSNGRTDLVPPSNGRTDLVPPSNGRTEIANTPNFEGFHSLYSDKLFFTANYGKIYSSYCYDLSSGKTYRLTQNGFSAYPAYDEKNQRLYYLGLNSYGFDVYVTNLEWNEFQTLDETLNMHPSFRLDENQIRKGGYLDNLKTMAPNLHLPLFSIGTKEGGNRLGVLLSGEDALAHFPYSAEFWYDLNTKEPLFDVTLSTRILAPFTTSVSAYNFDEKKRLSLDMQYPLLMRLSSGLSNFSAGFSGRLFNDHSSISMNRRELNPYLKVDFNFPLTNFGLKFSVPLEREAIGSTINRNGFYAEWDINEYIRKSELSIKYLGIYDPDNTYDPKKDDKEDSPFPVIRGYDNPLDKKAGIVFSADLTAPILPIKYGIFLMPYVFFEDVCAGLFFDASIPKDGKNPQASTGLELHLETNLAMMIPMDIGVRLVINKKDRKPKVEPFIGTTGSF